MPAIVRDPPEHFTPGPIIFAGYGFGILLLALVGAGLLTRALVTLIVLTFFALSALRHLVRLRPRRLGSTAAGAGLFILGAAGLVRWGDDIHFRIMEPVYLHEVALLPAEGRAHWLRHWDGGLGSDVSIYWQNDTSLGDSEAEDAGCLTQQRHIRGHFYRGYMECNLVPSSRKVGT